uniref:Uncharacterized protein n=1 Tax=Aegilops tauschii subsp. strangulata TaxID=200361 RepID=A0A453F7T3_AEGTS
RGWAVQWEYWRGAGRRTEGGQGEQQKTSQWAVKRLTQLLFPCEVAHGLACVWVRGARGHCGAHTHAYKKAHSRSTATFL